MKDKTRTLVYNAMEEIRSIDHDAIWLEFECCEEDRGKAKALLSKIRHLVGTAAELCHEVRVNEPVEAKGVDFVISEAPLPYLNLENDDEYPED